MEKIIFVEAKIWKQEYERSEKTEGRFHRKKNAKKKKN